MKQQTNTDSNDWLDEILSLFELEVESRNIGQPTFKTLTKAETKVAIQSKVDEMVRLARVDALKNVLDSDAWSNPPLLKALIKSVIRGNSAQLSTNNSKDTV